MPTSPAATRPRTRAGRALRKRHNWVQLGKFCVVGAVGYIVNLAVYTRSCAGPGSTTSLAATCSFLVAVTNNYLWNRLWTFRDQRGHVASQGLRFLVVSLVASARTSRPAPSSSPSGADKVLAQAIAIVLVTPLNFVGNKLW